MIESTPGTVGGALAPGLSLPLTSPDYGSAEPGSADTAPFGRHSRPDFAAKAADAARLATASAEFALRALPGLDAWSLACRRKTLRGVWRGWLLKSHKSVR
jgi:hypothetical protein